MLILNLGAGKIIPPQLKDLHENVHSYILHIDQNYYEGESPEKVEGEIENFRNKGIAYDFLRGNHYCKVNIVEFLEKTRHQFDTIYAYRFLEHIQRSELLYFIYLLSTATNPGSVVEAITPNYELLAKMLLDEKISSRGFDKWDILVTTEMLNERNDPHLSIWTPERAQYYFEYEKRFKVDILSEKYEFDGRDIYMKFIATKI